MHPGRIFLSLVSEKPQRMTHWFKNKIVSVPVDLNIEIPKEEILWSPWDDDTEKKGPVWVPSGHLSHRTEPRTSDPQLWCGSQCVP